MKNLIALALFTLSFQVFAQETHTPHYKCTNTKTAENRHILIGNSFPQTADLDWSKELRIVTAEQYKNGEVAPEKSFQIFRNDAKELSTFQNDFKIIAKLDLKKMELKLYENATLIEKYICARRLGI